MEDDGKRRREVRLKRCRERRGRKDGGGMEGSCMKSTENNNHAWNVRHPGHFRGDSVTHRCETSFLYFDSDPQDITICQSANKSRH